MLLILLRKLLERAANRAVRIEMLSDCTTFIKRATDFLRCSSHGALRYVQVNNFLPTIRRPKNLQVNAPPIAPSLLKILVPPPVSLVPIPV